MPAKIVRSGTVSSPIVAHIPHASTFIPDAVRQDFVVDDETLQSEIVRLTDWHTDQLFSWVLDLGGTLFVNEISRLVFDPERFVDDEQEPAARYGQGVVYTQMSDGRQLAAISTEERAARIKHLYEPYHEGLAAVVQDNLERFGTCLLLDCHSYPREPLPTETTESTRPDICIGTDAFHTPLQLAERFERAMCEQGFSVEVNSPFEGTFVPVEYWQSDRRVQSVMIEVKRDLYCDEETGERANELEDVRERLKAASRGALR